MINRVRDRIQRAEDGLGALDLVKSLLGLKIPFEDSIYPVKGDAPETFNRDTSGTYVDENGQIQTAAIDVPRITPDGILIEPDGEYLLPYSEDLSNWSQANVSVTNDQAEAPDGNITADLCAAVADFGSVYSAVDLTINETHTFSFYYKEGSVDQATIAVLRTGDNAVDRAVFDISTKTFVYEDGGSFNTDYSYEEAYNGYVRVVCTFTPPTSATYRFYAYPGYFNANSGDSDYPWGMQLNAGSYPISYGKTEITATTRTRDELSYNVSNILTAGQGSLYCEFIGLGRNSGYEPVILTISDGTADNRLTIYINTSDQIAVVGVTGGSSVIAIVGSTVEYNVENKVILTYENNNVVLYFNGVKIGTDLTGTIPANFGTLNVGQDHAKANQLSGTLKDVRYYKEPLSEAKALLLTWSIYAQTEDGTILRDENNNPIVLN